MKKDTKKLAVKEWTLSISFASSGRDVNIYNSWLKRPICRGLARLDQHEFQQSPVPYSLFSRGAWYKLNKPLSRLLLRPSRDKQTT